MTLETSPFLIGDTSSFMVDFPASHVSFLGCKTPSQDCNRGQCRFRFGITGRPKMLLKCHPGGDEPASFGGSFATQLVRFQSETVTFAVACHKNFLLLEFPLEQKDLTTKLGFKNTSSKHLFESFWLRFLFLLFWLIHAVRQGCWLP